MVTIKCHKRFNMKYGNKKNPRQIRCAPLTILLMAILTLKGGKLTVCVSYVCRMRRRCIVCLCADGDHTSY